MEQLLKLRKSKNAVNAENPSSIDVEDDHEDLFEELNALLGESDKLNNVAFIHKFLFFKLNFSYLSVQIKL